MPTIFALPKSFADPHIKIIQTNAITSWTKLGPDYEILLVGDEPGIAEISQKLSAGQIKDVKKNEFGTPLLSSAFDLARQKSNSEILIYANSDIIFLPDFNNIFKHLPADKEFLAIGRRWDLDIKNLIDFNKPNWEKSLKNEIKKNGRLHSEAGIDYFIFKKNLFKNLPAFAVGRVGWDNWMIYEARIKKMPVIDITQIATVIHQNHDYPAFNKGIRRKQNQEARQNMALAQNGRQTKNINDATYKITNRGLQKKYFYWWASFKNRLKRYLP